MTEQELEVYQGEQKPTQVVSKAREQAKMLSDIINQTGLSVNIGGHKHIRYEAWQTLGAFTGVVPYVDWTRPVEREGEVIGYECRALAMRGGQAVSSAEAQCTNDENNWSDRELWQIRSMAQTRACAKALRNVLGWIVVLAGYEATPLEEMTGDEQEKTARTHCPVHGVKWIRKGSDLIHKKQNGRWCNAQQAVNQAIRDKAERGEIDEAQTYEWIMEEYGTHLGRLSHEKMMEVYERLGEAPKPQRQPEQPGLMQDSEMNWEPATESHETMKHDAGG